MPTWPNHPAMFDHAGLEVMTYRHFDPATQSVRFDELMAALDQARAGDLVLLHGCCHNPTGADLTREQWRLAAERLSARGLIPLIDLAYQGLGDGLEEDAAGLRILLDAVDTAMVAYSCDKNFGLYRERTGALFVRAPGCADVVRSNMLFMARSAWSMPPDHGAAAVRTILASPTLSAMWRAELETMRRRLVAVREALAQAAPHLAALRRQRGMFSLLPVAPGQVERLRREHGVYMAGSGRINLAGLAAATVPTFVQALDACLLGEPA
jgi:aromatic-amino-acid transaminase